MKELVETVLCRELVQRAPTRAAELEFSQIDLVHATLGLQFTRSSVRVHDSELHDRWNCACKLSTITQGIFLEAGEWTLHFCLT